MDCQITDSIPELHLSTSPAMVVDYTLSTSQVFQSLTKYIINRDQCWEVLDYHTPEKSRDLDLPSWTADWRAWSRHRKNHAILEPGWPTWSRHRKVRYREGEYMGGRRAPTRSVSPQPRHRSPPEFDRHSEPVRQDYRDWDVLRVRGNVVAWCLSDSRGNLEIHVPDPVDGSKGCIKIDERGGRTSRDAAGVIAGDILAKIESGRHEIIVLRPKGSGGHTFVKSTAQWSDLRRKRSFYQQLCSSDERRMQMFTIW